MYGIQFKIQIQKSGKQIIEYINSKFGACPSRETRHTFSMNKLTIISGRCITIVYVNKKQKNDIATEILLKGANSRQEWGNTQEITKYISPSELVFSKAARTMILLLLFATTSLVHPY